MLKHPFLDRLCRQGRQPPSGGCVLKQTAFVIARIRLPQPPSGGCVLKRDFRLTEYQEAYGEPAAFGRLCVET